MSLPVRCRLTNQLAEPLLLFVEQALNSLKTAGYYHLSPGASLAIAVDVSQGRHKHLAQHLNYDYQVIFSRSDF